MCFSLILFMKVMAFNKCNVLVNIFLLCLKLSIFFPYILKFISSSNCMKEVLLLILCVVLISNLSLYILTEKFVDIYSSFIVYCFCLPHKFLLLITIIRIMFFFINNRAYLVTQFCATL